MGGERVSGFDSGEQGCPRSKGAVGWGRGPRVVSGGPLSLDRGHGHVATVTAPCGEVAEDSVCE